MRLTSERSWEKMAADSDLLEDVFLDTDVDQKVVSDLSWSLESDLKGAGHGNAAVRLQSAAIHVRNSDLGSSFNVQGSKVRVSQQAGKIAAHSS